MAGCTDQSYVDKTCPQKLGFKNQEWVGMIHCGTESNGDTDWGGCKVDPANSTDLFKLPNESCDDYCATTLWVGVADIPSFAVSIIYSTFGEGGPVLSREKPYHVPL